MSGFMLRIELIRIESERTRIHGKYALNIGTEVYIQLQMPWMFTDRHICAVSYLSSIEAAEHLYYNDFRFTGVVKNATVRLPMRFLDTCEIIGRGDHQSLVSKVVMKNCDEFELMDVSWVGRNRRYFVFNTGKTLPGRERKRVNKVAQRYLETIYIHSNISSSGILLFIFVVVLTCKNRYRQDDNDIERGLRVKDWSSRVKNTILSVNIVYSQLLYKDGRSLRSYMKPVEYYAPIVHQLIDKVFDTHAGFVGKVCAQ